MNDAAISPNTILISKRSRLLTCVEWLSRVIAKRTSFRTRPEALKPASRRNSRPSRFIPESPRLFLYNTAVTTCPRRHLCLSSCSVCLSARCGGLHGLHCRRHVRIARATSPTRSSPRPQRGFCCVCRSCQTSCVERKDHHEVCGQPASHQGQRKNSWRQRRIRKSGSQGGQVLCNVILSPLCSPSLEHQI